MVQLGDEVVLGTAEQELKQAPGVSIITAEDIRKRPPVNDLSEIIRTMPGVNLTGNSSSGQRGNNRQIDIRGMGPENTLILVDGKPVSSRNSVRYGWRGERDSRGDTNWVPADQVPQAAKACCYVFATFIWSALRAKRSGIPRHAAWGVRQSGRSRRAGISERDYG